MRALVAIPTLSRADLLLRNKDFLEGLAPADEALVLDNGNQTINLNVPIVRPAKNLGVPGSWNAFLRRAFCAPVKFDLLVILQDDIIWDEHRLDEAKRLLVEYPDVDLFLSPFQFSVQVHRPSNIETIGLYDERFFPAWCEDDDYALTIIKRGRIYQRFISLDPLPGSIANGTDKGVAWPTQKAKLVAKWGRDFGVNNMDAPHYWTNRGLKGIV
jgi:GT2 family glycosyltransferase